MITANAPIEVRAGGIELLAVALLMLLLIAGLIG
jgi:hypothetical protein